MRIDEVTKQYRVVMSELGEWASANKKFVEEYETLGRVKRIANLEELTKRGKRLEDRLKSAYQALDECEE